MGNSRDRAPRDTGIPFESDEKKRLDEKLDSVVFGDAPLQPSPKKSEPGSEIEQPPLSQSKISDAAIVVESRSSPVQNDSKSFQRKLIFIMIVAVSIAGFAGLVAFDAKKENDSLKRQVKDMQNEIDALKKLRGVNSDCEQRIYALENEVASLKATQNDKGISERNLKGVKSDIEALKKRTDQLPEDESRIELLESKISKLQNN